MTWSSPITPSRMRASSGGSGRSGVAAAVRRWRPWGSPVELERAESDTVTEAERPWITLVWNDPVNLMSYVTYVLHDLLRLRPAQAEQLMLDVHHKGRAVVSNGTREEMERDVAAMHSYGLWATMQKDD
jgi:ATP-dependent Clp protease adaptor protein ClpS